MNSLVIPGPIANEIAASLTLPVESAGVLLARRTGPEGNARLLARELRWVPENDYDIRAGDRLSISSEGYVSALGRAEADGSIPIWFHTHPGADMTPLPSRWDQTVDEEIADLFRLRSGSDIYGTLITAPGPGGLAFTGSLQYEDGRRDKIDRLWTVGTRWRLTSAFDAWAGKVDPIFDRSVRAFGPAIQQMLGQLRIAIVGAGGTGSALAEQLVRLGVRDLLLIDGDQLTASNVTRVYGSSPHDVGSLKVDILRRHLMTIAPDLNCETVSAMITLEPVARMLTGRDLVFGCTDDNAGRLVLSRLATYFLTPVIDVGVLLSSSSDGQLTGIDGRVTVLSPGNACLVCRERVDLVRAASELKTPEERKRLEDEGYAPALGGTEPAVVAFTTMVAAMAVNELLERLIGYGVDERPSEVLLRLHDREISGNCAKPRDFHYCNPALGKWGAGEEQPFLGQLWPT